MGYTKQQVVIDLEEYNDLLKLKEQQENSDLGDYQLALFTVINFANRYRDLNMNRLHDSLATEGLILISEDHLIEAKKVIVGKINKG